MGSNGRDLHPGADRSRSRDSRWDRFEAARRDTEAAHARTQNTNPGAAHWQGPRWVVSLRALIVVLAMLAAAVGVLWIESAGVQGASAELGSAGRVTVPPLGAAAPRGAQGTAQTSRPSLPATGVTSGAGPPEATAEAGVLVVHVAGAVVHPGIYKLAAGSRVFQAVDAAGGALPAAEPSALNLAAPLSDGVQVFIPTKEQAAAAGGKPGSANPAGASPGSGQGGPPGAAAQGPVNLNTASAAELEELPGVGPVLAGRIVAWRSDHGPFASVEGLSAVSGIGTKLLAGLSGLVVVS